MPDHVAIYFKDIDQEKSDILVAALSEAGFSGFEESPGQLIAYTEVSSFNPGLVEKLSKELSVSYEQSLVKETNWNEVWESNFSPVTVDDFVSIRADFHDPVEGVEQEIIITPKMSFGTGHHATTWLMIHQMRQVPIIGKRVADFGTGTGVLAILAEKMGATNIHAIDNDSWSIENAKENLARNGCTRINLYQSDLPEFEEPIDLLLANINKNVLLETMPMLAASLDREGVLLMSGLLENDEPDIVAAAAAQGLHFEKKETRSGWICLQFRHEDNVKPTLN